MSDTQLLPARRPQLQLLFTLVPRLSRIVSEHFVTVSYALFVLLTMGRMVRGRSDVKTHATASEKEVAPAPVTDADTCPICQEPIGTRNAEGIKEGWSMLPCGHRFGSYCIKHYLGIAADDEPLCPVCRHPAYYDACGHPVLPFVLKPNGTHPDLVAEASGRVRPPKGEEALTSTPCEFCQIVDAGGNPQPVQPPSSRWVTPVRWLRLLVPFHRRSKDRGLGGGQEPSHFPRGHVSRQERERRSRRNQRNDGVWEGPWVDVRHRDPEWEKWWKQQAPREA